MSGPEVEPPTRGMPSGPANHYYTTANHWRANHYTPAPVVVESTTGYTFTPCETVLLSHSKLIV